MYELFCEYVFEQFIEGIFIYRRVCLFTDYIRRSLLWSYCFTMLGSLKYAWANLSMHNDWKIIYCEKRICKGAIFLGICTWMIWVMMSIKEIAVLIFCGSDWLELTWASNCRQLQYVPLQSIFSNTSWFTISWDY